jgi:hypothetical protein
VRGSGTQFIQPGRPDDVVRLLVGRAAQLTARPGRRQEAGPRLRRLDLDDLIAQRQQQTEQLLMLGRGDVELVEHPLRSWMHASNSPAVTRIASCASRMLRPV